MVSHDTTMKSLQNKAVINHSDFDKKRANDLLRLGIHIIQGKVYSSYYESTLQDLLLIKEELEGMGAIWQAKILNYWIHRFQKQRNFLRPKADPGGIGGDS